MRWYVEITSLGSSDSSTQLCVEGKHWQKALTSARLLRGEAEQLSGLSVEFLDEGCRAIDPGLRLRYVVSRAPDDAPLAGPSDGEVEPSQSEAEADGAAPPAAKSDGPPNAVSTPPVAPDPPAKGRRALAQTMAFSSRGAVEEAVADATAVAQGDGKQAKTMAFASPGAVEQAVDGAAAAAADGRKKLAKTMAFVSPGAVEEAVGGAAAAVAAAEQSAPVSSASGDAPGAIVEQSEIDDAPPPTTVDYSEREPGQATATEPDGGDEDEEELTLRSASGEEDFELLTSREVEPTDDSPLRYREYVFGVKQPVTLAKAEQFMRRRFAALQEELDQLPAGKVVNIALFDHLFDEQPKRPPMVTLSWKDWRGGEPNIVFFPYSEAPARPQVRVEAAAPSSEPSPSEPPPPVERSTPSRPPASRPPASDREGDEAAPTSSRSHRRSRRQIARRSGPQSVPPPTPSEPPSAMSEPPRAMSAQPPATSDPPPRPFSEPPGSADRAVEAASTAPAMSAEPEAEAEPAADEDAGPPTQPQGTVSPPSGPAAVATPEQARPSWSELTPEARARSLAPRPSSPGGPRLDGDDLLTDMFEAMAELHFLGDALEGADFVLALALEKLPSEVGLVSLFDINRRQYVVVRQAGGERSGLLLRLSQRAKLAQQAMRFARAVVVTDASSAPALIDERWARVGVTPRSLICAPVELGGRYLGLIELANPHDGVAFKETDGHALTYIGRQFAEFVAERGVIVDPDIVLEDVEGDPS